MIIGTRTLTVDTPTGERSVEIRIFAPEQSVGHWTCRYEIDWPEGTKKASMDGADALAAIHGAMMFIGIDLYASPYHEKRKMWWARPFVGYGFPVPKGAREILTGEDQKYFGIDDAKG
jgi:hypothetical protein